MGIALIIIVFIGTFLLAGVAVAIAAFVQDRLGLASAAVEGAEVDDTAGLGGLLREESLSSITIWQALLRRLDLIDSLKQRMDEADLQWSVGRVTLTMLLLGGSFFALVQDSALLPPGSGLGAFVLGAWLPYWFIERKRQQRIQKFEAQFPDALESLARMMRAGHPISSAFEVLGSEVPAPLGTEFRRMAEERRLGAPLDQVMENFTARVKVDEVRLFVAATLLQARAGGRLTEVLERLAETLRENAALRGEVRALSAQGKMTGTVLTLLPLGIAIMLYLTATQFIGVLIYHPYGKYLIWTGIACVIAGHLVIQRIVKVKV
jgi:tight adherence protein B